MWESVFGPFSREGCCCCYCMVGNATIWWEILRNCLCHQHNKLREEKFYREISTVILCPKTQPVVPSEKDGKGKRTLEDNKSCDTLHPYFGSTVEGVCKQTKISHEVVCHKQSNNGEVLRKMYDTYLAESFISVAEGNQCPQLSLWSI